MVAKKTILVVEDEHFLADIYKRQLETSGCGVHVAYDGEQALKAVKRVKPDVILLDLIMPVMNGFEFLEALRALPGYEHCRVVVLTNLGQETDKQRCKALGVHEYLVKIKVSVEEIKSIVLK